ncbi:MAG TPA: family 16 glycoside hydrolase, partial [Cyclobacteriaceae bacterium]
MRRFLISSLVFTLVITLSSMKPDDADGWINLFDGKTFNGWKISKEHPETFTIKDGMIAIHGDRAHLFYEGTVKD